MSERRSGLERALAGLLVVPFLLGAAAAPSTHVQVAFSFRDPAITESSGLVALGGLLVTTNDSGDTGRVFTVDTSGRTVGVTHWSDDPTDVEALAPAGDDAVWVGDIGDNPRSRETITVARVPVGRGERTVTPPTYDLVYPEGAHDAETMFSGPDGRLYLATKGFLGGEVYVAPARLAADRPNRLQPVGRVLPMATDGAVLPDGRHVLVRGYASAALYTFPGFERVRSVPLPRQPQGEGVAVAADGTVYLSTEGARAEVLTLQLPAAEPTATPTPDPGQEAPVPPVTTERTERPIWPWALGGVVGLAMLLVLARSLRPR